MGGLGFVGLGKAAERLAAAASELPIGSLAAACSQDREKAESFAKRHGIPAFYERYEEMLADSAIAGVVIASANCGHERYALAAARAGKHVFCEKPMGRNAREARAIWEASQRCGIVLGVGYHHRYHPLLTLARELIRDGALGPVQLVRGRFYVGPGYDRSGWRASFEASGGGALTSTGVHVIDAFHYLLGEDVRTAALVCDALPVEETCTAMLTFESGTVGIFDTSRSIPGIPQDNDIEIIGANGTCLLHSVLGGPVPRGTATVEANGERRVEECSPTTNLYGSELANFLAAIASGSPPVADGAAGLAAAQVMDTLYRNAVVCAAVQSTPITLEKELTHD